MKRPSLSFSLLISIILLLGLANVAHAEEAPPAAGPIQVTKGKPYDNGGVVQITWYTRAKPRRGQPKPGYVLHHTSAAFANPATFYWTGCWSQKPKTKGKKVVCLYTISKDPKDGSNLIDRQYEFPADADVTYVTYTPHVSQPSVD